MMDKNEVAIATICWARDAEEEALLKESISVLSRIGLPVYLTDGGSSPDFIQFLEGLANIHLQPTCKGLWRQASSSLNAAANRKYILYTEPDKLDFFLHHLHQFLSSADPGAGITLASRSADALRSFPSFQQFTEAAINGCCTEVTGQKADHTYGPFLMRTLLIPSFNSLPEDIGWGWRTFAFANCVRQGYKVEAVVGNYECPISQREASSTDRLYRMKQLAQNIQGLVK